MICGDKLAAELCDDDDSDCPCYRKGRDLPKFLMMLDLIVLHLEMILVNGGH
ncbi:MAG: hypothetical protein Q7V10_04200 [Methanobacteriaceae archaeon]|nr:hypothetical protein [Methanobacteriaceae archaeon]MDO9626417.1 hypothetical protein [Methanobacteriaceae archaeon]